MTDLHTLKARIEKASGHPDDMRAIFKKLWAYFDLPLADRRRLNTLCKVDAFESAALALVERMLPGWGVNINIRASSYRYNKAIAKVREPGDWLLPEWHDGHAATPALALLSALVAALLEGSQHDK